MTKEQINAEGWKSSDHFPNVYMRYDDEWCYGLWILPNNRISLSKGKPINKPGEPDKSEVVPIYDGECLDIEQFKSITSKLNIAFKPIDALKNINSAN